MKEFDNKDENEIIREIQHMQGHLDNLLYFGENQNYNSTQMSRGSKNKFGDLVIEESLRQTNQQSYH